jgi:hypothetical protein
MRLDLMRLSRHQSQAPEHLLEFAEVLVARAANLENFDRVCRALWPDCLINRQPRTWCVMPFGNASAVDQDIRFCVDVAGN